MLTLAAACGRTAFPESSCDASADGEGASDDSGKGLVRRLLAVEQPVAGDGIGFYICACPEQPQLAPHRTGTAGGAGRRPKTDPGEPVLLAAREPFAARHRESADHQQIALFARRDVVLRKLRVDLARGLELRVRQLQR